MSQAVIDFCEGLKTTLLGIEDRLTKAKASMETGATKVSGEASKHVEEAAEQLKAFRVHAGLMAQAVQAELPGRAEEAGEKLKEFGLEAQVAMRHAVVFLAETASRGAEGAAGALQVGAKQASALAEKLRHDTAVTVTQPQDNPDDTTKSSSAT